MMSTHSQLDGTLIPTGACRRFVSDGEGGRYGCTGRDIVEATRNVVGFARRCGWRPRLAWWQVRLPKAPADVVAEYCRQTRQPGRAGG